MQTGYVVESFTVQTVMEHREQNQDVSAQRIALQHTMIGANTGDEKYGLLQKKNKSQRYSASQSAIEENI
tara:strand:+ start:37 stop:246 length:210 start_codon:yes stop_codon:yes gene_type:complete